MWVEISVAHSIDVADERPFFGGVDRAVGIVEEEAEGEAIVALCWGLGFWGGDGRERIRMSEEGKLMMRG